MGNRRKFTPDELTEKVDDYFRNGGTVAKDNETFVYTKLGLASFLGIHRDTLHTWEKEDTVYSDIVKEAYVKIEKSLIENAIANKTNANATMFLLKCKYGYRDNIALDENRNQLQEMTNALKEAIANARK